MPPTTGQLPQEISHRPGRHVLSIAAGALAGLAAWLAFELTRSAMPTWLRLIVATFLLVVGPGAALTARLLAPLPALTRFVMMLGFGVAFVPILGHVLGLLHIVPLYPYLAASLTGGVVGYELASRHEFQRPPFRIQLPALALIVLTAGTGAAAFAHRLTTAGDTVVYGEYDSYDISYYAAIGSELSHTIPPMSPFYAGRELNHSFYPHVLLALLHRFGDVPILELYFRYAWPGFFVLVVLLCFVVINAISTPRAALLSALFLGFGSDLSYLARFFDRQNWDDVIWSHNFQGAGAEVLLYNNWTPALIVFLAGVYAMHAAFRDKRLGWAISAGVCFAATVLAKPWIFATLFGAVGLTTLIAWRDRDVRRPLMTICAVTILAALPFLYRTFTLYDDAQVTFAPTFLPIPLVMVERLGLRDWFMQHAAWIGGGIERREGLAGLLAMPLFVFGSLGYRLAGVGAVWRCLRRPADCLPTWQVLAWTALAAFVVPAFVVSVPYHETTQIHQFCLFLLALFVGDTIATRWKGRWALLATAVLIAIAIPSTVHYVARKWNDQQRPFGDVTRRERPLVSFLRLTDPERTVVLHNRPTQSTLVNILSERRSLLSWGTYVRGRHEREEDIHRFFASANVPEEVPLQILKKYRPTHVIEYRRRDHINQALLDRLDIVFLNEEVALYEVPERLFTN